MTLLILLSAGWLGLSAILAHRACRGRLWAVAVLLVTGIPVLGMLTHSGGPVVGLLALAAGAVILSLTQWPLRRTVADG